MRSCFVCGRLLILVTVASAGCQKPSIPPMTTAFPVAQTAVSPGAEPEDNHFLRVDRDPTQGMFVAGMSVVKVANQATGAGDDTALYIAEIEQRDTAYWTNATRDLTSISFLTFFDWSSVPTREVTVRELLTAAHRLDTRLLLVYAANDLAANASELVGGLYDTETGKLLGAAKSYVVFERPDPEAPYVKDLKGDFRVIDARYQAAREFERLIHDGIYEIALTDSPEKKIQPNDWGPMQMPAWPWPVRTVK